MPIRPPIDDVTTILPKRCRRITGMAARSVWNDAGQVGVHQLLPNLVADLLQRPGADDSGVGHHDVEAAQFVHGLLDGRVDLGRVAHIEGDRQAAAAQLFDPLGGVA